MSGSQILQFWKPVSAKIAAWPILAGFIQARRNQKYLADHAALISSLKRGTGIHLFDASWYISQYPDVAASRMLPLVHYLKYGSLEGRNPSPLFMGNWYLDRNPDVAAAGVNPLVHYLSHGEAEGRDANPLFMNKWYLELNPDVAAAAMNPLSHYLSSGAVEGRDPNPLFDSSWYLEQYRDVAEAGINPLIHYLYSGAREGRDPSPRFMSAWYLQQNLDVLGSGQNPLVHYLCYGMSEGRNPTSSFDRNREARAAFSKTLNQQPIWISSTGQAWTESFQIRLSQRMADLASADVSTPLSQDRPTFSIITTVFNTDPDFVRALADSVSQQVYRDFEWLILDNGSTASDTVAVCRDIADSDTRFKLYRVDSNLHIIGGNRFVFDLSKGHYIVPIDSDDILYDDSLALVANVLREEASDPPVLIYSDEQKVSRDGEPLELIWRWDYSVAHAMSTVPAAHLMIFSRQKGFEANVYSDDYAKGSHDWDTALRVTERGGKARHIPEVLYGWRVHEQSTASNPLAKDYILESQAGVLKHALERRGIQNLFSVEPLFSGVAGWYQVSREHRQLPAVNVDFVVHWASDGLDAMEHNLRLLASTPAYKRVLYPRRLRAEVADLRDIISKDVLIDQWIGLDNLPDLIDALNELPHAVFAKAIISSNVSLRSSNAIWEAVGLFELDVTAGVVGGVLEHAGIVQAAGLVSGLDGFVGAPFQGWPIGATPAHILRLRHIVSAFPSAAICVRGDLLRSGCILKGLDLDDPLFGIEFCLDAHRLGYTSVLDHHFAGEISNKLVQYVGAGQPARSRIRAEYSVDLAKTALSPHLARSGVRFGSLRSFDEIYDGGKIRASMSPAIPLNLQVSTALETRPTINLLLPAVRMESMSGGPNTALNIAYRLAKMGFAVRIVSTDIRPDDDLTPIWDHIVKISGGSTRLPNLEIIDGSNRMLPIDIGVNDVFFATAWWTAVMAHAARDLIGDKSFVYLIQDFEPILYPASSHYALAKETYGFPHLPLINTTILRDYFIEENIGLFAQEAHRKEVLAFEPAIDPKQFFVDNKAREKRRLLFYARPSVGIRNLYEIGLAALRAAVADHVLSADWDIIAMGEVISPVDLGGGAVLRCALWLGFDGYAKQMRESDVLLSLMLSPHPSYPPLEMAGCGGLVVTNTYANKTAGRLAGLSPNIIAVEPTVADILSALEQAVGRLDDLDARSSGARTGLPETWDASFSAILPALAEKLRKLGIQTKNAYGKELREPGRLKTPSPEPGSSYALFLALSRKRRAAVNVGVSEKGLLGFVTTVWNTAPAFLDVLAHSMQRQTGGTNFEWLILDNGSTCDDTRAYLDRLAERPYVRLQRVDENLGIIGGMRYCLERATARYILPLDSDDYLYPDCVQTLTWYIQKHNYPALLYTDEDKLIGERVSMPFQKSSWDPVLFAAQCYIAHLCAIDRKLALKLGAYNDPRPEGSHDWDTFTRFCVAGYKPVHVPHILYSWRLHAQSTAGGNMESKPVVFDSQRSVLGRLLNGSPVKDLIELQHSPLFGETPDWWLRRRRKQGRPITTIIVRAPTDRGLTPDLKVSPHLDHDIMEVQLGDGLNKLRDAVGSVAERGRLVHILASETHPIDDEWAWEAIGQFDLYPDTVAVGGRIHSHGVILEAGRFLGFGNGCDCPDRGRTLADPGYSAQMWKPRSVNAVSANHAVFDAGFMLQAIDLSHAFGGAIPNLGSWLGGLARRSDRRVIYSPFLLAETSIDWEALVTPDERGLFFSVFADLIPENLLRPANMGLSVATAYESVLPSTVYSLPFEAHLSSYADWMKGHEAYRIARSSRADIMALGSQPIFSVLTTVYIKTDVSLFDLTVNSVLAQTFTQFEWIVLAHGPITADLQMTLERLSAQPRVRVLWLDVNLGIVGGMHHVLTASHGNYVVSLDSDDLITSDALSVLYGAICASRIMPAFVYTDEDLIVGDRVQNPYLRPSWDPVLDLENSWIWHLCAMDRVKAIELGVYTDQGAEYCHDWDSVERFTAAGYEPLHIPEITYHWRQHVGSTSNNEGPNELSAASVAHVLSRKIERLGLKDRMSLTEYPIWRGAKEWWIERDDVDQPPLFAMISNDSMAPLGFEQLHIVGGQSFSEMRRVIDDCPNDGIIAVIGRGVVCSHELVTREVIKLFECVSGIAVISGRIVHDGCVISAGLVVDSNGCLRAPLDGSRRDDPGPYALGWKAHSIAAPTPEFLFARCAFLKEALDLAPLHTVRGELGLWLGAFAASRGMLVAYSPLVTAEVKENRVYPFDPLATNLAWLAFQRATGSNLVRNQGTAAYATLRIAS